MAERFLTYDQEGIIRKLSLRADEEYLYLTFLSFGYRVNRRNGGIQWFDRTAGRWREAQYNDAMTIYDLLCCSKEDGRASGQYVMLQNLASVASGTMFAGKGIWSRRQKGWITGMRSWRRPAKGWAEAGRRQGTWRIRFLSGRICA